jgi:hypothetical protein
MGRGFGLALGDFRKGSAARQGAGKPVSRLTRFISQDIVCCCAFRSARERCRHSIYRALRPWPSAADGTERSAEKRDADARGRGGKIRKDRAARRLGAVVSLHIPPTGQDRALSAAQDFGVVSSFAGETDIVGQTSPQGAEAMRQW